MNKRKLIQLFIAIIGIISTGVYSRYMYNKTMQQVQVFDINYPYIKRTKNFKGTVAYIIDPNIEASNNHPYHAYLIFEDSTKASLQVSPELNSEKNFDDILRIGSTVVVEKDNDTVYVINQSVIDTLVYSFLLRDSLGYPLPKNK
jgi:hypothetical protein